MLHQLSPILLTFAGQLNFMQKKGLIILFYMLLAVFGAQLAEAQCSICTKTASQLGEGPAKALNSAILYLAGAPLAIMGYIGWRWWKKEKEVMEKEEIK